MTEPVTSSCNRWAGWWLRMGRDWIIVGTHLRASAHYLVHQSSHITAGATGHISHCDHLNLLHINALTCYFCCPSQIEKDLCFASAEFEDFVLQFLDRYSQINKSSCHCSCQYFLFLTEMQRSATLALLPVWNSLYSVVTVFLFLTCAQLRPCCARARIGVSPW